MAFENFPSAEPTPPPSPVPQQPRSNLRTYITAALIIALLATWGYILWDKSKTKEIIQQKDTQYASMNAQKDTLQNLLDEATFRYDSLKTNNAKKDSTILMKDKEITEKTARIRSILSKQNATKAELAEAKGLIASLNSQIDGYKQQITVLEGEKTQLTQEKMAVTEQRDKAIRDFDSTRTVVKQREDVIDIGSTLHASNFNIIAIDEKKNGKEKETTRAKKADKLRISFDLDENRISTSGSKQLFVCITDPNGKAIAAEALGSGNFTTRDGEDKSFTQKIDINYVQGQRQVVSFDWKQNTSFIIGDYKIEVYHNGFKIGGGVRHMKKGGLFG